VIDLLDDVVAHFGALLDAEPRLERRFWETSGFDQPAILDVAFDVTLVVITPLAKADPDLEFLSRRSRHDVLSSQCVLINYYPGRKLDPWPPRGQFSGRNPAQRLFTSTEQ